MKKFLTLLLLLLPLGVFAQEKIKVYVFVAPTCGHCIKMKHEFLPAFTHRVKDMAEVIEIDTSKNSLLFKESMDAYGAQYATPAMAIGQTLLQGYPPQIGYNALATVQRAYENGEKSKVKEAEKTAEETFASFSLFTLLGAGLADGVNPCAFAVIIFFISFLAVHKYTKKQVLVIGAAYCAAVFTAYLLIGLGIFNFLYAISGFQVVVRGFYLLTVILCFLLAALSIYDLLYYSKHKNADGMLLQLPKSFKMMNARVTGFFLRKKDKGLFYLVCASFAVGMIISLIEAVCTGQVYVPVIMMIMKDPAMRLQAAVYLVLYNVMFILPLLAVFGLSFAGYSSDAFNNFFKKHLALTRGVLAAVFITLGCVLFF